LAAPTAGFDGAAVIALAKAAIIYDPSGFAESPGLELFQTHQDSTGLDQRGRGAVYYLATKAGPVVLRRYRRGGLMAHLSTDRYLWLGAEATRPFREFRLTAALYRAGLPVPQPLAAAYWRSGMTYQAALITKRIDRAETLAERWRRAPAAIDWAALGSLIARFHALGICHADLNAHNILLDPSDRAYLIDFDRGRWRPLDAIWPAQNLARLHRSLCKIGAGPPETLVAPADWAALESAWRSQLLNPASIGEGAR
jgi:3-deoxy-D-manno-octulosonic acid kinase